MNKVKILQTETITHDVKHFVLEKPTDYQYKTSQATSIAIDKDDWREEKRPFTFISLSEEPHLEFFIKRYPKSQYPDHGGVTEALHKLGHGDTLLIEDAWGGMKYKGPGIFIAGGTGITPFISISKQLLKEGKEKGNTLLLSNKTKKDVILADDLKDFFGDQIILNFTRESDGRRIDKDYLKEKVEDFSVYFYICGSKKMISDIQEILKELGAKEDKITIFES